MNNPRFEAGLEVLKKIDGAGAQNMFESLNGIAPDLGKFIIEFAFGDLYTREELTLEERELLTITSLVTTGGCEPQLEVHINGALNVGISCEKIVETILHCIPYIGFPKVINAIFVAKRIFEEKKLLLK